MTTITRTEYETTEKEIEITVCDCCELERDDCVQLSVNPQGKKVTEFEILDTADSDEVPKEWVGFDYQQAVEDHSFIATRSTLLKPIEAEHTFDVCLGCLEEVLGLDLPDGFENVELESDGITVETKTVNPFYEMPYTGAFGLILAILTLPVSSWLLFPQWYDSKWNLEHGTVERVVIWACSTTIWLLTVGAALLSFVGWAL